MTAVALCVAPASSFVSPAPGAQGKQKREEFGSSLKRLKWDEREQKAVETNQGDERPDSDTVIRVETSLAVFEILAFDKKGRDVPGLSKSDFIVTEDGAPQEVAGLSPGDGSTVPRSIILIIDYSVSQFPFIESSVAAAKAIVDRLKPNDRMAIVTDDVALLAPFTRDKLKLKDGLDSLRRRARSKRFGRSEQYSALLATLKELTGGVERPIIIIQTDGDELSSLRNADVAPPERRRPSCHAIPPKNTASKIFTPRRKRRGPRFTPSSPASGSQASRPKNMLNGREGSSGNCFNRNRNWAGGGVI